MAQWWRFTKRDTISLCFCGPAKGTKHRLVRLTKGVAVGAPLISIMYAGTPTDIQSKLTLALVIYNGEQVAMAQLFVPILRRWAREEIALLEAEKAEATRDKSDVDAEGRENGIG